MENKLGTVGAVASVVGLGVAVCNPVGATVLIAGGLAAGIRSVRDEPQIRYSGGGWDSGEPWLPVAQYALIWSGVTEIVSSVVLVGASLVCAPGCGVDMYSGLWVSVLLFVVGMVSTGAGFVYVGIAPDKEIEEQRPPTTTSLVKSAGAVVPTARPLATATFASEDNGQSWFIIINNNASEEVSRERYTRNVRPDEHV